MLLIFAYHRVKDVFDVFLCFSNAVTIPSSNSGTTFKGNYFLEALFIIVVTKKKNSKMGPNDAPKPEKKEDAKDIGVAFAQKYYKGAIRGPNGVMELFGNNSVYVGTNGKEAHGLEDIRNAIGNLNLQEGKILVVSINAAFTGNGGIMVQIIANYIIDESTKYGFSESFYLVSQSKGWYVRSCLFKWHDQSPEDGKSKESSIVVEEEDDQKHPNRELANGHIEDKKLAPEIDAEVTEEVKKPSDERKASPLKERPFTNGTSTPPSTPTTKTVATPQKDAKSPIVSAPLPSADVPRPPQPTSWAACVGGSAKSAVKNNGNTNVRPVPATTITNTVASDAGVKPPTTANANGNTSGHLEGTQDKQNRHNKKPTKAKSDYTVHVSKILKNKKATEKDVVIDVTRAFQEFGPIAHVRVPGRRLADDNETTLYAFVDFKEKEDFEKMFADREQDNEGRVKLTISLPVLQFSGEVIIAQNHDRGAGRSFYRNRRVSDNLRPGANATGGGNNARPGNTGRPPRNRRPSRNNGQSGNTRPPQTGNRNNSDNRRRENGTIKAKN